MASGGGNVSGQFCFPQGAGAVGEEKHIEAELFLLKLQMLSFISMLPFAGFSPAAPPPFHFSCDGCSHCEPPQAGRQVVYHSCD